jgi:hypothetical protein
MQAESTIDAARERANGGFFTFHGPWAPGVRLFRKLSFSGQGRADLGHLHGAAAGAGGVLLRQPRHADRLLQQGTAGCGLHARARTAGRRRPAMARRQRRHGPARRACRRPPHRCRRWTSGLAPNWAPPSCTPTWPRLCAPRQQAPTAATAADAFVKAANALLVQATDGSNLTLDPDIDSYYLMDGALFRLPDLIDQAAALRDLAAMPWPPPATPTARRPSAWARCWRSDYMDANLAGGLDQDAGAAPGHEAGAGLPTRRAQQLRRLRDSAGAAMQGSLGPTDADARAQPPVTTPWRACRRCSSACWNSSTCLLVERVTRHGAPAHRGQRGAGGLPAAGRLPVRASTA